MTSPAKSNILRNAMEFLLGRIRGFLEGLWVALLPSPERPRFARDHGLDAPLWSLGVGFIQGGIGVALFVFFGIAFFRAVSSDLSEQLLQNWQPGLTSTHFRATGMMGWIAWLVYPASWPWSYLALNGLGRCVAFAITREAFGDPLVLIVLRVVQSVRSGRAARRREAEFGPLRADKLQREGDEIVVVSCREKPGWDQSATVEIEGWYYQLSGVREQRDGPWRAIAYRLRAADETAAIRRLVPYTPPPGQRFSDR